jgi:DNA-binding response OmpR family regulator
MKVLLVEDDDGIRALVADVLAEDHGHEVVDFANAEAAWAACQQERFPLAILDWVLPGMDGLELCRRLRTSPAGDEMVILVMTARTLPDDLTSVLDAGADDYIAKPIELSLLDVRLTIAERRVEEVAVRVRAQHAAEQAAKLEGVLLAARTAAHEINNVLALPVGYAEILALHPAVRRDPVLLKQVNEIRDNAQRAADILGRMQRVIRLQEVPTPLGPEKTVLDMNRSVEE